MFWQNVMKISQIHIPYKFPQSGCIPSKIKCKILAHKGLQMTHTTSGDYLASWNRKPIRQQDLLVSMIRDQDFLGKVTYCRHFFLFFLNLDHLEERWGRWHNNDHHVWQILVWQQRLCLKSGCQWRAPPVPVSITKEIFSFLDRMVPFLSS